MQIKEDPELGIPQHRFRYYKCDERVVWDREERVDLIDQVAEEYQRQQQ